MEYCMKFGDTNFIGVVNADKYQSFVDEDWELDILLQHFADQMKEGNIIVFQMTEEGIQHSWNIEVKIGTEKIIEKCFRRETGYIRVTNNTLYLIDYDCLTMAAQFSNEKVPDDNCSNYKIDIENGIYKVDIIQYLDADQNEFTGTNDKDLLLHFSRVANFQQTADQVLWCSYI